MSGVSSAIARAVETGVPKAQLPGLVSQQIAVLGDEAGRLAFEAAGRGITMSRADAFGAKAMLHLDSFDDLARAVREQPQGVRDGVRAAQEARNARVAILGTGEPNLAGTDIGALATAIEQRGAQVMFLDPRRIEVVARSGDEVHRIAANADRAAVADHANTSLLQAMRGADEIGLAYRLEDGTSQALPHLDAVIARGGAIRDTAHLEHAGVRFVNDPTTRFLTLNKSKQAVAYARDGVAHPGTVGKLTTLDELRAGTREIAEQASARRGTPAAEFPVVVKLNNGHGGQQVRVVNSDDELVAAFRELDPQAKGKAESFLVQEFVPGLDSADFRYTMVRRPTGEMRVTSVHHRQGEGGIANGPNGSTYTRIPPSEWDPTAADEAVKAADAIGLDVAGADLVKGDDGIWYVLESNSTPGTTEFDVAVPAVEHMMQPTADLLVFGPRSDLAAGIASRASALEARAARAGAAEGAARAAG